MAKDVIVNVKLNGVDLAQKQAKGLNNELNKTDKEASKVGQRAPTAFGRLNQGAKKASEGIQGLGTAVKGVGLVGLVIVIFQLLKGFGAFEPVVDKVRIAFAALKAIVAELLDAAAALGQFLVDLFTRPAEALDRLQLALGQIDFAEAIEGAAEFEKRLIAVEFAEINLIKRRAETNAELAKQKIIAEDVTKSLQVRIAAAQKAAEIERATLEEELKIAKERLAIQQGQNALSASSRADLRAEAELAAQVAQLEEASLNKQIEFQNKINSLIAEAEAKRIAAFNAEQDRLLKIANLNLQIQREINQGADEFATQRVDIELERQQQLNEINNRIAKGEEVLQEEILLINIQADKKLREIDKQEEEFNKEQARKRIELELQTQEAIQKLAELAGVSLQEIADDEAATFDDRINANLELLKLAEQRIELDRKAALAAENLTKEQIDLINAQADAALETINKNTELLNDELEKRGGFLSRLFGFESQEDFDDFVKVVVASTQLVQNAISAVFAFQSQLLENRLAELDEYSAELDNRIDETSNNIADLQQQFNESYGAQTNFVRAELRKQRAEERRLQAEREAIDAQRRALQTEQAQREKTVRTFEVIINTASAIVRAFAELGPLLGGIFSGVIAGIGALQLSAIQNTPVPTFAKGGFTGSGLGFKDATGEDVAGVVHSNEYVIPKTVLQTPTGSAIAGIAEAIRTNKKGFADGGFTTPTVNSTAVLDTSSLNTQLDRLIKVTEQANENPVQLSLVELADRQSRLTRITESASI